MFQPCKVCNSERKQTIETLILNGESNYLIAKKMKESGFDISHASINRHKIQHMKEHADTIKKVATPKTNKKYDRHDVIEGINERAIFDEIKNQKLSGEGYNNLIETFKTLQLMLNRIVNNQMTITIDLQEKYMRGEGKYPQEQINGLKTVQDMLQKLETFSQELYERCSRYSINETIAQAKLRSIEEDIKVKRLKYGKMVGLMLPAEIVQKVWSGFTSAARQVMLSLPSRLGAVCQHSSYADVQSEATKIVYQALENIAAFNLDDYLDESDYKDVDTYLNEYSNDQENTDDEKPLA